MMMATKKLNRTYTVNYMVKAVVSTQINADTMDEALTLAKDLKLDPFRDGIEFVDGDYKVMGVEDDTSWGQINV
jgi:hypothetical protein